MVPKLVIIKTIPKMVVHCVDGEEIWASSNYTLYRNKDGETSFNKVIDLRAPLVMRVLGKSRLFTRALRLGVRSLRKLRSGTILVVANRKLLRLKGSKLEVVCSFRKGLGPLREGWCEDDEGSCYLAEYFLNNKRNSVSDLLKSSDDGQSWRVIRSLDNIRHIHCVQYDPFGKRIWLGTGDREDESSISFSEDRGESWNEIGSGDQMFRAVSLLFTEDYVYWGTDAPTRQNYIYRYGRDGGQIERLTAVDGPVHYSTILGNGIKLFATAAEGNSEGKNPEWDRKAHVWASQDGTHWEDIASWEKDFWPYILGFGMVLFAHGECRNNLYITTESLRGVDGVLFHAKLSVDD
jgi:hypothetical protein